MEIVIVVGIIAGSLAAILGVATMFLVTSQIVQQTSKASALGEEAMEIVRNYRDGTNWSSSGLGQVTLGSPYHPEQSGGSPPAWILVAGSETINEFTRQIQFEEVFRDGNDNIAQSGSIDPDTIQAIVQVSWEERGRSHEVELVAYFANWNQ